MRIFIFLVLLFIDINSQSVNFDGFGRSVKRLAGSSFGELNRTALTLVFKEEASRAGTSSQERVDTCSECIENYIAIKEELIKIGVEGAHAVGRIVNDTDFKVKEIYDEHRKEETVTPELTNKLRRNSDQGRHALSKYLPKTMEFINTKIVRMRNANISENTIRAVEMSMEQILKANAVEKGLNMPAAEHFGQYVYVRHAFEFVQYAVGELSEQDKIDFDKFFCSVIFERKKILSNDGTALNVAEKLSEGIFAKPLNFTPLIANLKAAFKVGDVDHATLDRRVINYASFLQVEARDYFNMCLNTVVGYRNMTEEHRKISKENRLKVKKALNKTNPSFDEIATYLPVTIEYFVPKINAMKQLDTDSAEFVELVFLHILAKNVVEGKTTVTWSTDETIQNGFMSLPTNNANALRNIDRFFCFNLLRSIVNV